MTSAEAGPSPTRMSTIYCISGLGATRLLFRNLNVPGHEIRPLDWISPVQNESIREYAARLAQEIDVATPPILLGVSFGGIVAIEMSHLIKPSLVIIVSSAKCRNEIPWYLRTIGALRIHRLTPFGLLRYFSPIIRYFNGTSEAIDIATINRIIAEIDLGHLAWGIDQLLRWPGCEPCGSLFHIHGSGDRVFPLRYVRPDIVVPNGPHVMIVSRAAEISPLIAQTVNALC